MSAVYTDESRDADPGVSRFGAVMVLLIGLLGIFYAAVLVASRSDAFRAYLQDRLAQAVGWPIRVQQAYVSFGLNVVVKGIGGEDGLVAGRPGLQIQQLILKISPVKLWRGWSDAIRGLEIEGLYLAVARDAQGAWQPWMPAEVLSRVAGWLGWQMPRVVPASEDATQGLGHLFSKPLRVSQARAIWYGDRDVLCEMVGVEWRHDQLRVAEREFMYRSLRISEAMASGGERLKSVQVEFLQTPKRTIVLRAEAQGRRPSEPASSVVGANTGGQHLSLAPPDEMAALRAAWFGAAHP